MKCFGKYGTGADCADCAWSGACRKIEAFDKRVYRSNRRYAVLKMDVHTAAGRGIHKPAPRCIEI